MSAILATLQLIPFLVDGNGWLLVGLGRGMEQGHVRTLDSLHRTASSLYLQRKPLQDAVAENLEYRPRKNICFLRRIYEPIDLPARRALGLAHRPRAPKTKRVMNKNAIVNCRWTVRPVRSDGQSLPGKDGKEVSNMDYVYFEQVGGWVVF